VILVHVEAPHHSPRKSLPIDRAGFAGGLEIVTSPLVPSGPRKHAADLVALIETPRVGCLTRAQLNTKIILSVSLAGP
jgi:hypothetical protein